MNWKTSEHISNLLIDTGNTITTSCGKVVPIYQLNTTDNQTLLSKWAKHFRNHYCLDDQIENLISGTGLDKSNYLKQIKFPDSSTAPGPSIRAGDFAEILVADYMEFMLNYWVPRTRFSDKTVRNESKKGCDVIGFKLVKENPTINDTLLIFESKAKLTGNTAINKLQEAIEHSSKDVIRKSESLNAIKQRFLDKGEIENKNKIERFQNLTDNPYTEKFGAAAVVIDDVYDQTIYSSSSSSEHVEKNKLELLIIKGSSLMPLVHLLYDKAGNEA